MSTQEVIQEENAFAKKHVDKKLIRRIKLFIVMYLALLSFIVYDIAEHEFNPILIIIAFVVGVGIGYLVGRIFNIEWHVPTEKVIARLDTFGIVILVVYIVFSIFREKIFGFWLHGPLLTAVSFTFATGAILGRILMMSVNVKKVLLEQGIALPADEEKSL